MHHRSSGIPASSRLTLLWLLHTCCASSRPTAHDDATQDLASLKNSDEELASSSGVSVGSVKGSDVDGSFFEYLPQHVRSEKALNQYYAKSAKETINTAYHVLDILPVKGNPCNILDVGSNVGTFNEAVATRRSDCAIYAFEPIQELYSFNVDKSFDRKNVVIENLALCETSGRRTIYRAKVGDRFHNAMDATEEHQKVAENIQCEVFDDYARHHSMMSKQIHAVKIDVAGSEWRVLRGMHCFLNAQKQKPVIFIKFGFAANQHPHWKEEVAEIEWLFAHGYKRREYAFSEPRDVIFRPVEVALDA